MNAASKETGRRRLGLALGAFAVLGVGATALWRGRAPSPDDRAPAAPAPEGSPQRLAGGRADAGPADGRERGPVATPASDVGSAVQPAPSPSELARRIRGVVTDDLGAPVEGAKIQVEPVDGRRGSVSATSDVHGRFEALGPEGVDLFLVSVRAAGHHESLRFVDPTEGDVPIRLPRLTKTTLRLRLEGFVPADGTEVLVELDVAGRPEEGAASFLPIQGSELRVRMEDRSPSRLRPGPVQVSIRGPDLLGGPVAVVLPASDETVDVTVALRRADGGRVRGVVRDQKGAVVAGAKVRPMGGEDAGTYPFPWQQPLTDAEGRFLISDLPPGVVELSAAVPVEGMTASSAEGRAVVPVGADDVQIVLHREVEVTGRVQGSPEDAARRLSVRWRPVGASPTAPSSVPFVGSFTIRLRPGTWELWAYDRPVEGAHVVVEVSPGSPRTGVLLPLPPGPARIRGHVLAPDGTPAPDALVDLPDLRDERIDFGPLGSTDREGRFDVPTVPGSSVRLVAGRNREVGELVDVPADGEPVVVRLVRPGSCKVIGRVLRSGDGGSQMGVLVALSPDGVRAMDCGFLFGDGAFLAHLPSGPWRLSASVGDLVAWPPADVHAVDGATLRGVGLPLVPGATMEGDVRDADGKPVVGAFVRVERDPRSDARLSPRPAVRTSEDGRFRHTGLIPGRWRVRASRLDWPRSVEDRVDVSLGEPSQVSLIAPR